MFGVFNQIIAFLTSADYFILSFPEQLKNKTFLVCHTRKITRLFSQYIESINAEIISMQNTLRIRVKEKEYEQNTSLCLCF